MIGVLRAASPAENRLLGGGRLDGPMPYVIAIMMFVMVVIGAAGLALARTASMAGTAVEQRYTIQLDGGGALTKQLVARIKTAPGVTSVRPVPEAEMRDILSKWLGPQSEGGNLPLPAMIDVSLAPGANLDALQAMIQPMGSARLIAHSQSLGPALTVLRALSWLALALVLLVAAAAAAAVVLATRGALDMQRATIEVMHGVGATDDQIARLFQRKIALDALVGGAIGAAAAGVVLLMIAGAAGSWLGDLTGRVLIGFIDILLLASLPILGTLLSTLVARRAVLKTLGNRL
jgi:cell division transport system permease protein